MSFDLILHWIYELWDHWQIQGAIPAMASQKLEKGANISFAPKTLKENIHNMVTPHYKCGVTGMTYEYFVTGQVKKDEYHINTSNKYLHNLNKMIYLYHFPTYYM